MAEPLLRIYGGTIRSLIAKCSKLLGKTCDPLIDAGKFTGIPGTVGGFQHRKTGGQIEGLVHVSNMTDDHYIYDESSYSMTGERTRKTYKLGQPVKIRVESADKLSRTIDFSMLQ